MPDPKFKVPPEGYFAWTKKLGQRHYAKAGFDSETLCGMPMLGNNYASAIPISDQTECQKCADILSSKLFSSCPYCGTRFAPSGTCPKCGTFVPEKMWYEPHILPGISYSYAEMQFRIKTCQDVDTLKKVYSKLDTSTEVTEFDKELLKEEIAQRMQVILEHEESHKTGAGEKFAEGAAEYGDFVREQKSLENFIPIKTEPKDKNKTPLELEREERLKQFPTEDAFRTAKTKYADFLETDFHLKSYKDKAEEYKPNSIQYNKYMAVYNARLKEIAELRKEAAAGKTILELRYEEADRQNKEYEAEIEAHQQKLQALRGESYESLLIKAKQFNAIWGDESKAWKDRYKGKDEVKDIISALQEKNIDIIPILNAQLHELQKKFKMPSIKESSLEYTIKESDDEIIQQIKNEQGTLEGLKCTTIKAFHKLGYTVVVMKSYQEGESIGSKSLYDINFKEESSAKRLEAKLKVLFKEAGGGSVAESTPSYDITNIEDIKKIKLAALSGVKKIWVVNKGREGLILAAKYGKEWWEKASQDDVERITVYERSAEYSHISDELSIVETNLRNVGYDLRNDGRGHMVLPNGKGVSPTNHRGIVNHWEVIVDAGYLPSSNIFKLKHSPDAIVAGAINKGWRRWSGEASYEIRDLSKPNADFINKRLKQHFDNSGLHDAHIDVWSEGKYYNFDKTIWDKSNHDILHVVKKITPRSYQPAKAMDLKLMENEYLIRDPASIGDPDTWIVSKGAAFIDDIRGAHHGQVDGTLIAYDIKTSITIGYIDYSIFEGKLYLNSIEVESSHRRHGYATALLLKLKKLNPGMQVKWGMMTEAGCALKSAVDKESPDNPTGIKVYYKGVLGEKHKKYQTGTICDRLKRMDDFRDRIKIISSESKRDNIERSFDICENDKGKLTLSVPIKGHESCIDYCDTCPPGTKKIVDVHTHPTSLVNPSVGDYISSIKNNQKMFCIAGNDPYKNNILTVKCYSIPEELFIEKDTVKKHNKIADLVCKENAICMIRYPNTAENNVKDDNCKNWSFGDYEVMLADTNLAARLERKQREGMIRERREYTKAERISMAKAIASTIEKTTSESEGETCISIDNLSKLSKDERIRLAKKIAGGSTEVISSVVRKDDDAENLFKDVKEDCSEWDFGTFEAMLPGLETQDDIQEMLECIISSEKLSESEIETLRTLIEKNMEE